MTSRLAVLCFVSLASAVEVMGADKPAPQPVPPVEVRAKGGEYGPEKWTWEGVAVVRDPVNKEMLYLGGRCGGAEFGTLGNWALGEDGKTWREIKGANSTLDPLREKCLAARKLVKEAEAAARVVFYAAMDAGREAEAIRNGPGKWLGQAAELVGKLSGDVAVVKGGEWETAAAGQAAGRIEKAGEGIKAAVAGLAGGRVDAELLKKCFQAQWQLDEAAAALASSPGPRYGAYAGYDSDSKCVVLFGGSHGDYVMGDTWVYDCMRKTWRQVWPKVAPSPRALLPAPPVKGVKVEPTPGLAWSAEKKALVLAGGSALLNKMVYQQGYMAVPADEWAFEAKAGQWTAAGDDGKRGAAPGTRAYRTIVPAYDPCWFDAAGPVDASRANAAEWLAGLKANTWTKVPIPERPAAEREWGTARYDPDRDQIYRWSGGHQADPSDVMTTYHPGLNRYSIGYVAGISGKGMSFDGRPDCQNHTYLHWAYDPLSKRLVCTSMGGTGVYNPDRMDWDYSIAQPFNHHIYETCTVGTPQGLVVWTRGYFGMMDVKGREWKKLPVTSKLPRSCTDGSALTYDSKRDCIWLATHSEYQKPSGNIWQYDVKSGAVKQMDPAGLETVRGSKGVREMRECIYLPKLDLVLYNNFLPAGELAYDPAKNRWVALDVPSNRERLGTVSDTLVHDTKRDLVWNLNAYKLVYVLKLDAATLKVSDIAEPTSQPAKGL
jgi:hypothetical protein